MGQAGANEHSKQRLWNKSVHRCPKYAVYRNREHVESIFKTRIYPFQAKEHGGQFQNLAQMREIAVGRFVLDDPCVFCLGPGGRQKSSKRG